MHKLFGTAVKNSGIPVHTSKYLKSRVVSAEIIESNGEKTAGKVMMEKQKVKCILKYILCFQEY